MSLAPDKLHTLIASGDVYIRSEKPLQSIPEADVVCYGLWVDPSLATHHGVFASDRKHPEQLDFMLQKPSLAELESLSKTHLFLMLPSLPPEHRNRSENLSRRCIAG